MSSNKGGRPRLYKDRQMVWGYLDRADYDEVVRVTEERDLSKSQLINALVRYALANMDHEQLPLGKQVEQEELPLGRAS